MHTTRLWLLKHFCLHNTLSISQHKFSYRNYAAGDYNLLYSLLCVCDWSCVCKNNNVDDTVDCFTSIILQATDLAILWNTVSKPKFSHWLSPVLKYYIRKKNYFCGRYRKHKSDQYYSKFSYSKRLVKITNKSDRLNWYKVLMII
jgi:hypothetical protein